jgi:proteasome lid subunit RPN8/RPN11
MVENDDVSETRIVMKKDVWDQFQYISKKIDSEIGVFGVGKLDKNKDIVIRKWLFPEQEVTGATVTINKEHMRNLIKNESDEDLANIILYWHVHPGMSVNPSGTDMNDTFDFAERSKLFAFLISGGTNRETKVDIYSRLVINSPVKFDIVDIKVICEDVEEEDDPLQSFLENIKTTKLKKKTYDWDNYKKNKIDYTKESVKQVSLIGTKKDDGFFDEDVENKDVKITYNIKSSTRAELYTKCEVCVSLLQKTLKEYNSVFDFNYKYYEHGFCTIVVELKRKDWGTKKWDSKFEHLIHHTERVAKQELNRLKQLKKTEEKTVVETKESVEDFLINNIDDQLKRDLIRDNILNKDHNSINETTLTEDCYLNY